jgi:hypothetical protein
MYSIILKLLSGDMYSIMDQLIRTWSALASGLRVVYISKRIGISISPARNRGSHTETNERLGSDKHDVNVADEIITYRFVISV